MAISTWKPAALNVTLLQNEYTEISADSLQVLLGNTDGVLSNLDIALDVKSGTPSVNSIVEIHFRMGTGQIQEVAPNGTFAPHYEGRIILDNKIGKYFTHNTRLISPEATLYLRANENVGNIVVDVYIRARGN